MYYNARWYDPSLGRFAQADSIVPAGVQGYDRYAYVNNNPLRYTDPTGHMCSDPEDPTPECEGSGSSGGYGGGGGNLDGGDNSGGDDDLASLVNTFDPPKNTIDPNMIFNPFANDEWVMYCQTTGAEECVFAIPRPARGYFDILRINPNDLAWEYLGLILSITGIRSVYTALGLSEKAINYLTGYHTLSSGYSAFEENGHMDGVGLSLTVGGLYQPAAVYTSSASVLRELSASYYEVPMMLQGPPAGPYCDGIYYC